MEAITYWGMTDAGAWLGAPSGLVRADGSPKQAYDSLRRLVKDEWWLAPTPLRTDGDGRVRVTGWRGAYELRLGSARGPFVLDGTSGFVLDGTSGAEPVVLRLGP